MTTLFISDLHLHPSRPEIIDCFLDFLASWGGRAGTLYILGDLFEAWIGDDQPEAAYQAVKAALRDFTERGTAVRFLHGNRDFLVGTRFAAETGCTLLDEPARIDLYGTATLLMHGDALCTGDEDYQELRRRFRDPRWQQQVLQLPVERRLAMAREARELSVLAAQERDQRISDVDPGEVRRIMEQHQVRLLIHGHTHRPGSHRLQCNGASATRIVLGDWYRNGSVLVAEPEGLELQHHDCAQRVPASS
ncbi:MAG TPA: UDP-2,3-diacylglucosamine diphosphatase [Gammaproteobacteria bacterium]|nr:UDP-2,3-diacylglucosamine diphosphatase [Gammaproteobacteria bacterium]